MSMLTKLIQWIYSLEGYYFFKSGMYLDFYIKRAFTAVWTQLNVFLGIFFLEKFVVERITKRITSNFLFVYTYVLNIKKNRSTVQLRIMGAFVFFVFFGYLIIEI
jgi:hypothetical protein